MKKSFSMDCLQYSTSSSSSIDNSDIHRAPISYVSDSDGLKPPPHGHQRRKGVAWTEEEHRRFLIGLEKLGKGDWRGISRTFVTSRSPTQVASHAQKFFLRHSSSSALLRPSSSHSRRSSLFDMPLQAEAGSIVNNAMPAAAAAAYDLDVNAAAASIHILKQRSSLLPTEDLTSSSSSSSSSSVSNINVDYGLANNALLLPLPDLDLKLAPSASASASLDQSPPLVGPIRVTL